MGGVDRRLRLPPDHRARVPGRRLRAATSRSSATRRWPRRRSWPPASGVTMLPRLALTTIHPGVVVRHLSRRTPVVRRIWAAREAGAYQLARQRGDGPDPARRGRGVPQRHARGRPEPARRSARLALAVSSTSGSISRARSCPLVGQLALLAGARGLLLRQRLLALRARRRAPRRRPPGGRRVRPRISASSLCSAASVRRRLQPALTAAARDRDEDSATNTSAPITMATITPVSIGLPPLRLRAGPVPRRPGRG